MAKRFPWIWLAILAIFVAVAIFLKRADETVSSTLPVEESSASPVPTTAYLFPAEEGVVTSILIESREGKIIAFERQGEVWVATKPYFAETVAGSVEAAASQVTALPIQKSLDLDPSVVGLNSPAFTITVGFTSGHFIIVQVGDEDPTGANYYVRKGDGPVLVLSKNDLSVVLNMLTQPPLADTPTPSPAPPTETPTVTPTSAPTETAAPATATKTP